MLTKYVPIETIKLHKEKFTVSQALSKQRIENCTIDLIEHTKELLEVRLSAEIWGELVKRQEVCYPKDWWQAFKLRWFPPWMKKRWPVKEIHVIMDAVALYPSLLNEPHTMFSKVTKLKLEVDRLQY